MDTIMAGLRCAAPSPAAWPSIQSGIDAFLSVADKLALEAIDILRQPAAPDQRIDAGPSGACGIGALLDLLRSPGGSVLREAAGVSPSTTVMAIVTEGA
jgi:diaminopropionate ammonia-lyase